MSLHWLKNGARSAESMYQDFNKGYILMSNKEHKLVILQLAGFGDTLSLITRMPALLEAHPDHEPVFYLGGYGKSPQFSKEQLEREGYESALIKSEEIKDKRGIASSLRGLGVISASQQDFEKHLDYINRAKHIYEEIGDERGIFLILHDIGNYYRAKGNYNQALDYYKRSISLSEKFGNQALSLFTTGRIYEKMGELDLSLDYYFRSQKLFKEQEDYFRLQAVTACIGIIYLYKNPNIII